MLKIYWDSCAACCVPTVRTNISSSDISILTHPLYLKKYPNILPILPYFE